MESDGEGESREVGASWFSLWVDGEWLTEGPGRFHVSAPEWQSRNMKLGRGKHVVAVQVHHIGLATRMLESIAGFLWCEVRVAGKVLPVQWKCAKLGGYGSKVRRVNAQFGWIEWCDTRGVPGGWKSGGFDDSKWEKPADVNRRLGKMQELSIGSVRRFVHAGKVIGEGELAEMFGYERDDIPVRFFLRDLECKEVPAMGVWKRYDLGRVRLMKPRFVLDVPAGAVVEFGYSEALSHARVGPWITLSASDSCNLDHYVARGGVQEFEPLTPKGGRFVEVHVLAPVEKVKFVKEEFVERGYYDGPEGAFKCGDELLERIWNVGIETFRACAEDALIDNPTRERGQWAGDVVAVGMDIAAAAYSDLRLCRRGLVQSAQCAREDGLVSGLCPGGGAYLSTYAAQWISACIHYWELTGDRALLDQLFPVAERNVAAFELAMTDHGLRDNLAWGFVDWGYVRNDGPSDIAVDLHYLAALRDMLRWCRAINKTDRLAHYQSLESRLAAIITRWLESQKNGDEYDWPRIGYHRAALTMRLGFFQEPAKRPCIQFIKSHILDCFPNNPAAPRLSDPNANNPRLITPYFGHYALPLLIEAGEMDFVLDQYRRCWGWALDDGRTTWLEVFDTRWSHCHQWAGCPTWQLSRYVLGLQARFDLGTNHFAFDLRPGSLPSAQGAVPLRSDQGLIKVTWQRQPDGLHYRLQTPRPLWLHFPSTPTPIQIDREYETVLRQGG
ncbi:MAG: hypothetical protein NTU53_14830 [Planctomycetota bacterium]|nr:hypothetical protein [Planctomycetota bacterium]